MKTGLKIIAIAVVVMLALPFFLQCRFITVETGERVLLYVPLNGHGPGGAVGAYLREELQPVYGEVGVPVETAGFWQGKAVTIADLPGYEFAYLGRELGGGGHYMECTVTIERTVRDAASGEQLGQGRAMYSCLAYDDGILASVELPHVLWGTLKEQFYGIGFDAVPAA